MLKRGNKKCLLLVGTSGSGKSTLEKDLVRLYPEQFTKAISVTTRWPRDHEVDGKDYYFITGTEFHHDPDNKYELIESVKFAGFDYGLTVNEFINCKTDNLICVVEPHGSEQIIKYLDEHPELGFEPIVIYFKIKKEIRIKNMLLRGDHVSKVINRLRNDNIDSLVLSHHHWWKTIFTIKELNDLVVEDVYDFIYGQKLVSSTLPGMTQEILTSKYCSIVKTHYLELICKLQGPLRNMSFLEE